MYATTIYMYLYTSTGDGIGVSMVTSSLLAANEGDVELNCGRQKVEASKGSPAVSVIALAVARDVHMRRRAEMLVGEPHACKQE